MKKKLTEDHTGPAAREPYAHPELKELGQVSALTQAGSMGMAEGGGKKGKGDDMKSFQ